MYSGVIFLLLFSCVTSPKSPDPFQDESVFLPLEPGASAYLLVDVPGVRPVIDQIGIPGMSGIQAKEILDRTWSAAAAFFPEGNERRFQAAAWGKYPEFGGRLALAAGKDWKRERSKTGGTYYHSAKDGLSVALNASQAFASGAGPGSAGDPFAAAPGTEAPEGFAEFRRGAVLALWLTDPAPPANRFFAALGIPLQLPAEQLFVSLLPHVPEGEGTGGGAEYEALIRIQTPAAGQARALLALINMARVYAPETGEADGPAALAAALFANPPVQDGRNLNLRTAAMDPAEIALLFSVFSIYSD
ncbi:MAG: hypothetical protein LBL28_06365 [Treponema sp.]|nr:hypothetical protein [Treponema sp.]